MRRSVAPKVLAVALLAVLVPCAALSESVRLDLTDTLVPGHVAVVVTNDGDACVSSSIAFDVRIRLVLDVVREVEGRTVHSDTEASVRFDSPLCQGESRINYVPITHQKGTVTSVQLLRTLPRTENIADVLAENEVSRGFAFGMSSRYFALIGIERTVTLIVSLLIVLLAWNSPSSSRYYLLLWLTVLIVIIASRWSFLTAPRANGTDPYHVLEEARTILREGTYPHFSEQVRPGYAYGFNILLATILLLTNSISGVFALPFLALPVVLILSRRLGFPSLVTPLATLLLFSHTYHIAMTANALPSVVSVTLMSAVVVVALLRSRTRTSILFLLSLTVAVSHSGGFLYLVIALACTAVYLSAIERCSITNIGASIGMTALLCLLLFPTDGFLFGIGLLCGGALVAIDHLVLRPSEDIMRTLMLLGGTLLVITMNTDVKEYLGSRALGGTALGVLMAIAFFSFILRREQLELPLLLAMPHVLWSISAIPLISITMMGYHRMRIFLVSLLGISLLGGRALVFILDSARGRRFVPAALLILFSIGLLWSHLDRVTDIGIEPDRLHLSLDYARPLHPAHDLRDVVAFLQGRIEGDLLAYGSPAPFYGIVDKRILLKGWNIPLVGRERIMDLCSQRMPPLVVTDVNLHQQRPGHHDQLVQDLESTCYSLTYSNPTFNVYASRS